MATRNLTIRLSDEDEKLFERAVEADGLNSIGTWLLRAGRLHARKVTGEQTNDDLLAEFANLVERMQSNNRSRPKQ